MLPFLKNQADASASAPVDSIKRNPDDGEEYDPMHAAAEEFINAVHAKDQKAAAEAWRAGHELLNNENSEEE